jgi:xanthine dehydrogenase accessory factor
MTRAATGNNKQSRGSPFPVPRYSSAKPQTGNGKRGTGNPFENYAGPIACNEVMIIGPAIVGIGYYRGSDIMFRQVKRLLNEGETLAIATIVSTLGSTPREVGAKMVVSPAGEILGTVGGGCGEAEVRRQAVQVIRSRKPALVRVELMDDIESNSPAVCGGILNVFVDPWWQDAHTPACGKLAEALLQVDAEGAAAVMATVVSATNCGDVEPGNKCLIRDGMQTCGNIHNEELLQAILKQAEVLLPREECKQITIELPGAERKAEVFFDVITAVRKVIIVGAGHLAIPLAKFAKILGFHITVLDDRVVYANRERFPDVDEVLAGDMAETLSGLEITSQTYIVLITRGHQYDEPCLRAIIHSPAKYIGMIGSKRRIKACFIRFRDEDKIPEELLKRVYAPIGLDIRAESPEEIALSIIAEMVKVRRGGTAQSLAGH